MKGISIRLRYTVVFALILGAAIALSVFFNSVWLEDYYILKKEQVMLDSYGEIDILLAARDNEKKQQEKNEGHLWNFNPYINPWGSIGNDKTHEEDSLVLYLNAIQSESNITTLVVTKNEVITANGFDADWLMRLYLEIQIGGMNEEKGKLERIKSTEEYDIIKLYDSSMETNYLVCMGKLKNDGWILLRTPLTSIADSAAISNRFYIYVGLGALILGTILMYLIMGLVTKPITSLTQLSKRMSQLDFEAKYEGKNRDEIGELGQHMNEMSETLQNTIAQLKTANLELQRDIDAKNIIARERSEFVANVSHELKTPIALIQGYAEGLTDGVADDPESMAFYCDVILDEANKMNHMVKRLLSLNQLEFGQEQLDMSRFDLTQLIKGVADASGILARQKEAVIIFERKEPLYIWADEYRIEEVISNFVSNAIHYVSGKNIIEIKAYEKDGECFVDVYNSGSQIPPEDLKKIWDKFYKVDKARTREYGGSGIGLSIVKAVMELHGGSCGVKNTDDGVIFSISIPLNLGASVGKQ